MTDLKEEQKKNNLNKLKQVSEITLEELYKPNLRFDALEQQIWEFLEICRENNLFTIPSSATSVSDAVASASKQLASQLQGKTDLAEKDRPFRETLELVVVILDAYTHKQHLESSAKPSSAPLLSSDSGVNSDKKMDSPDLEIIESFIVQLENFAREIKATPTPINFQRFQAFAKANDLFKPDEAIQMDNLEFNTIRILTHNGLIPKSEHESRARQATQTIAGVFKHYQSEHAAENTRTSPPTPLEQAKVDGQFFSSQLMQFFEHAEESKLKSPKSVIFPVNINNLEQYALNFFQACFNAGLLDVEPSSPLNANKVSQFSKTIESTLETLKKTHQSKELSDRKLISTQSITIERSVSQISGFYDSLPKLLATQKAIQNNRIANLYSLFMTEFITKIMEISDKGPSIDLINAFNTLLFFLHQFGFFPSYTTGKTYQPAEILELFSSNHLHTKHRQLLVADEHEKKLIESCQLLLHDFEKAIKDSLQPVVPPSSSPAFTSTSSGSDTKEDKKKIYPSQIVLDKVIDHQKNLTTYLQNLENSANPMDAIAIWKDQILPTLAELSAAAIGIDVSQIPLEKEKFNLRATYLAEFTSTCQAAGINAQNILSNSAIENFRKNFDRGYGESLKNKLTTRVAILTLTDLVIDAFIIPTFNLSSLRVLYDGCFKDLLAKCSAARIIEQPVTDLLELNNLLGKQQRSQPLSVEINTLLITANSLNSILASFPHITSECRRLQRKATEAHYILEEQQKEQEQQRQQFLTQTLLSPKDLSLSKETQSSTPTPMTTSGSSSSWSALLETLDEKPTISSVAKIPDIKNRFSSGGSEGSAISRFSPPARKLKPSETGAPPQSSTSIYRTASLPLPVRRGFNGRSDTSPKYLAASILNGVVPPSGQAGEKTPLKTEEQQIEKMLKPSGETTVQVIKDIEEFLNSKKGLDSRTANLQKK